MRYAIFVLFFVLFPVWGLADTIHVPDDQPTIQAGIDAAVDGDTVLVADGTYTGEGNRNIDFLGKAIIVRSENGAKNCFIDCEWEGRGFYFHNGEGQDSVLQGFTIGNGSAHTGGGINCQGASPTIDNNIIIGNWASGSSYPPPRSRGLVAVSIVILNLVLSLLTMQLLETIQIMVGGFIAVDPRRSSTAISLEMRHTNLAPPHTDTVAGYIARIRW